MSAKHHDAFSPLAAADLASVHGGLFGPLDPVIGFFQRREEKNGFCADARHWDENARKETDPQLKAQAQSYADYKRALCRAY